MKLKFRYSILAVIVIMMTQCAPKKNYPDELDKMVPGASFIFKGKVLILHTTLTDEEDVSNTGAVVVNEVLDAPEALGKMTGEQITVRFADINKVKAGDEMIFFTEPYWVGESIGVEEKASVPKSDKLFEDKEMISHIAKARNKYEEVQLKQTLSEANMVMTGKVMRINEMQEKMLVPTEHNPEWKEAEIQIDEMIKGKNETKTMKVLFASGKDVMFFEAPKLKEGDEGIFMLKQSDDQTAKSLRNNNLMIEPTSFIRGKEKVALVKSLIK